MIYDIPSIDAIQENICLFSLATCSGSHILIGERVNGISLSEWNTALDAFKTLFHCHKKSSYSEVLLKIAGILRTCDFTKNEIDVECLLENLPKISEYLIQRSRFSLCC